MDDPLAIVVNGWRDVRIRLEGRLLLEVGGQAHNGEQGGYPDDRRNGGIFPELLILPEELPLVKGSW